MYEAKISAAGLRHLNRLPDKVRQAALETIFGPIAENPHRAGKLLGDAGFPMRDIGHLLGVSHQRISQILAQ